MHEPLVVEMRPEGIRVSGAMVSLDALGALAAEQEHVARRPEISPWWFNSGAVSSWRRRCRRWIDWRSPA